MSDATESPDAVEPDDAELDAYDLNHDGHIGVIEHERALLGVIDARLEAIAEEGGVKGKLADAAHHLLDKVDND